MVVPQDAGQGTGAPERHTHLGVARQWHRGQQARLRAGACPRCAGGDDESLVSARGEVADGLQHRTGDPVHVRQERLGDERDSHGSSVAAAARATGPNRPRERSVRRTWSRGGHPDVTVARAVPRAFMTACYSEGVTDAWLQALAQSPWALPAMAAPVVGDAFLVVIPGEAAVTTLGALAVAEGSPGSPPSSSSRRQPH